MILECTECRTRYVVPDSAIGEGRTVRCAACRHSWFQAPPPAAPDPPLDLVARAEVAVPVTPVAAPEAPVREIVPPAERDDDGLDPFAHSAPFKPRRNPARQWTIAAVAAGLAMLVGIGAMVYTGSGSIAAVLGLPIAAAETPLRLVYNPIERRDLANGSEMFAISGKVTNPTDTHQAVPDIRAELRDAQGRLVYSWTIRPEATALPPRGSVEFNSAKLDVPVNSAKLVLSFSGGAAS